jgi:hypothetical protein
VATKPIAPNKAVPCVECAWTTYPRAEQVNGNPLLVKWVTPASCGGCGGELDAAEARAASADVAGHESS